MRIKWNEQIGKTINGFPILEVKRENNRTIVKTICPYCKSAYWTRAERIKPGNGCGCRSNDSLFKAEDLSDKTFGRLTVLSKTEERAENGSVIWKCKCRCGNICFVSAYGLKSGQAKSCGCISKEWQKKHGQDLAKATKKQCIKNTNVRNLTARIAKNNTSGIKGVFWDNNRKKWVAQIMFQGKNYHLGRYEKIEDAASARKEAEENLFGNFLKWYENERKGEQ